MAHTAAGSRNTYLIHNGDYLTGRFWWGLTSGLIVYVAFVDLKILSEKGVNEISL